MADEDPKQRRFPRITAEHAVMVTKAGAETLEEFAKTRDLGLGGCMFLSDEPVGPGSVIELLISLFITGLLAALCGGAAYGLAHLAGVSI